MKHRHHIIPRHRGGSDEPDNLLTLTVEQHAQAHLKLFVENGDWEDLMAYWGLSGSLSKEDLVAEILSMAGKKGNAALTKWYEHIKGKTYEEIYGEARASAMKERRRFTSSGANNGMYGVPHTEEWKKSHSEKMSGAGHFNFGKKLPKRKRMMKDGKERSIRLDLVDQYLADGWVLGKRNHTLPSLIGLIWITNDVMTKIVNPSEVPEYLEKGWRKGKKKYNSKPERYSAARERGWAWLLTVGNASTAEYAKAMNTNVATAKHHLDHFTRKKLTEKQGIRRKFRYVVIKTS